jgi:hypothetical protein
MAPSALTQERLRTALRLLELVDFEGIRAKQQVARMLGEDAQFPPEIVLLPYNFTVESVTYHATITEPQLDAILKLVSSNGSTADVAKLISQGMLGNLFTAAFQSLNLLIAALTNTDLPKTELLEKLQPYGVTEGACILDGSCEPNYPASACKLLGGQVVGSCDKVPKPMPVPAGEESENKGK